MTPDPRARPGPLRRRTVLALIAGAGLGVAAAPPASASPATAGRRTIPVGVLKGRTVRLTG